MPYHYFKKIFSNLLIFTFLLNFIFPKAGIKINDLPITFGYALVLVLSLFYIPHRIDNFNPYGFKAYLAWVPFQILSLVQFSLNPPLDLGYFISFLIHFFIFPFIFFIILINQNFDLDLYKFKKTIKNSIFFLCVYGIIFWIYKFLSGEFFEIPGLTINFSDSGTLEESKFIDRGGIFKLISTYGNGNLFGICLLFFYPLYLEIETNFFKNWVTRIALILTLSRTIWIGLLIAELFYLIKKFHMKKGLNFLSIVSSIYFTEKLLLSFQISTAFLYDSNLGGRANQLDAFNRTTFLGNGKFEGIYEIVYLGILDNFGILGCITFLFGAIYPIFLYFQIAEKTPIKTHLTYGLILYGIISISDGALLLIPVMYLYYFISLIVLSSTKAGFKFLAHQ